METPEDMLGRLERMGESRVRSLIASGHFAPKAMGLVQGWLVQKEQAREHDAPSRPSVDDALIKAEQIARQAVEAAKQAAEIAEAASRTALRAHRLAIGGIVAGGAGLLAAILTLFAMALR